MTVEVPGPRGLEAFRTVKKIGKDPFTTLREDLARYGEVVRYPMGPSVVYFIHHPDHVRHVLETNHTNYRRSKFYARMKPLLGEGLITSDGELWKKQRRLIQKGFQRSKLRSFLPLVAARAEETAASWARHEGGPFDVAREMMGLSLAVAGWVMFHADVSREAATVEKFLPPALDEIDARFNEFFTLPMWVPTPRNRRFGKAIAELDHLVNGLIEARRRSGERQEDILDILMEVRDPDTGEAMADRQIRDEVMTLLLAGHETNANLLSWTLMLLAKHPEVDRALAAEVAGVGGLTAPPEALLELDLTRRVLTESLRLYPPAWSMDREAIADDQLGPYRIPAGSVVFLPPYFVHRHPDFWPSPETFDPDRWKETEVKERHRYAFIPFGGGPRLCIGRDLSLMNTQVILARLMARWRLVLEPGHPIEMHPAITLRPRHGLKVRAFPREA